MTIGALCNREVIVTGADTSAAEAAKLMKRYHVGDLVVVDDSDGARRPIGLITDRDLVVEVLAAQCDPQAVTVTDLMTRPLATVAVDAGFWDALSIMRRHGVRRLPVVEEDGALVGILTLDDALELIGEATAELVGIVGREIEREKASRPDG